MAPALSLGSGFGHRDVLFAAGILFVLTILFLPIPAWALDVGLAISLSLSVLILMVVLWIEKPIAFSSFPMVLLVATMLRLALNIASTRLILSQGHNGTNAAGGVIEGFSQFIMGGNFVIGIIVFAILVIVNFVVITKGATRIAEVGARFTLDAIPGKQMAIDADLSAGLIDETQARTRRKELEDESTFFGAMDGASKFVRGDAVAGLIITFINVLGGMIIGVAQMGMDTGAAAAAYTTLTVGDGLASQVPAVIVSLAAGLLVAKGGTLGRAEQAVMDQLGGYPKALAMVSILLLIFAAVPGLPALPFLCIAAGMGSLSWILFRKAALETPNEDDLEDEGILDASSTDERAEDALQVEDIQLDVNPQLVAHISQSDKGLSPKIKSLRRRFARDYGFLLPPVRIRDNVYLPHESYRISIQDIEVATGRIRMQHCLVIDPAGEKIDMPGEETREPTFNMPAVWIDPARAEEAEAKGYTVIDPDSVMATHLAEVIRDHLPRLLTYSALQRLLDSLPVEYHKLLHELIPGQMSAVMLQRVLQALLEERLSIRNLPIILEAVTEAVSWTRNITMIAEHVRSRLSPQICSALTAPDGFIPVITVSPAWEQSFLEAIQIQGQDRTFSMAPSRVNDFITQARARIQEYSTMDCWPAILTSAETRPFVRSLLERVSAMTPVISHAELHAKAAVRTVGQI